MDTLKANYGVLKFAAVTNVRRGKKAGYLFCPIIRLDPPEDSLLPSSSSQLTQYQDWLGYPKTVRYCLSRLCFEMTRQAKLRVPK
jgi:hypothetical protein